MPVVAVTLDCGGSTPRLTLTQKRLLPLGSSGASAETWRMPVCARAGGGGQEGRACSLLTEAKGEMPAPVGACPAWVLANDGELGYYRASTRATSCAGWWPRPTSSRSPNGSASSAT